MNHFFKIYKRVAHLNEIKGGFYNILPQRDLRFAAKIKWVRPERKPVYHPSSSGDLSAVKLPPIDTLRPPFQNSEELKNASDEVKKVFSLHYVTFFKIYQCYEKEMVEKVRRHPYDNSSVEVQIAKLTAKIRFLQPIIEKRPSYKKRIKIVKELIDKRKKQLKLLRKQDYKKFEWILEELDLIYRPQVEFERFVSRKKSLELLAKLKIEIQKEEKLSNLKKSLDEQKVPFLEKKLEKLKWIKEMEEKKNLPQTVIEEDINECVKRLENVKIDIANKLKSGYLRKIHPYTLEPYNEKLLLEKEASSDSSYKN